MNRSPRKRLFKKRPVEPQEILKSKFEAAAYRLASSFFESDQFEHAVSKGEEREIPIHEFLDANLPDIFSVVRGEVVDSQNETSGQLDIMIYDNSRSIPFYNSGNNYILPAEALLSSTEVKSKLNKQEVRNILIGCNKLKSLKPFNAEVDTSKRKRSFEEKISCRFYHTVFAYGTDITTGDWAKKEFDRLDSVGKEMGIDPSLIDRVFVLNKGLINFGHRVVKETSDNAEGFLYYYMGLLNFILRENSRRETVPYTSYAGRLSKGWRKF